MSGHRSLTLCRSKADTIYIGGGTPSILSAKDVGDILLQLRQTFEVADDAEITIEANPESLDGEKAAAYVPTASTV